MYLYLTNGSAQVLTAVQFYKLVGLLSLVCQWFFFQFFSIVSATLEISVGHYLVEYAYKKRIFGGEYPYL